MIRTALVTGAARGMGRAIALRLARDGLNVAVNDRDENESKLREVQREIEHIGRKSLFCLADVSDSRSVEEMMKNASKKLGSLDVRHRGFTFDLLISSSLMTVGGCSQRRDY